ncbi:hypothetical protein CDAR_168631 [Caerostris darwini]|uniref:Uncharacterized protein n=1 Tax=Caerostris darwini TaxID=1538125 RepID=A0AAV4T6S7_9ARAC|nr:hypothetical protein CDAR_168631 [Caerostris darwini]
MAACIKAATATCHLIGRPRLDRSRQADECGLTTSHSFLLHFTSSSRQQREECLSCHQVGFSSSGRGRGDDNTSKEKDGRHTHRHTMRDQNSCIQRKRFRISRAGPFFLLFFSLLMAVFKETDQNVKGFQRLCIEES